MADARFRLERIRRIESPEHRIAAQLNRAGNKAYRELIEDQAWNSTVATTEKKRDWGRLQPASEFISPPATGYTTRAGISSNCDRFQTMSTPNR